jgi:adenylate cyclase class 2
MLEQEVKLQFDSLPLARAAVVAAGARLMTERRLIDDQLFDTPDGRLGRAGTALRVRRDGDRAILTVKGPVIPGPVKSREELETSIGDAATAEAMLTTVGFTPFFRAQKYREEYSLGAAHVAVDETPAGVYVEIEGTPAAIAHVTHLLGRTTADYRLESYMSLWRRRCQEQNVSYPDMVFERAAAE